MLYDGPPCLLMSCRSDSISTNDGVSADTLDRHHRHQGAGAQLGIGGVLLLALAAAGGVALIETVTRRSDVGALLVLGLLLFDVLFAQASTSFFVGPVRVGTSDLLFILLLTAAVARLLRIERFTTAQRLLIAFGLLVVWSIMRGAGPFGAPAAINEARTVLRFFGAALYFSTIEPRRELLDRIGKLWLFAAVVLSALAIMRWGALAAGVAQGMLASATGGVRVLTASETLVIAIGAFLAFPMLADRQRNLTRFLGPAMLVVVVLLQHRSVWVVGAVGTTYLLFRQRTLAKHALTALVAAVAVLAVLVSTVFYDEEAAATEQLAQSAQSTGTWEWRVAGWTALLRDAGPDGPEEFLAGRPFGTGWERRIGPLGGTIDVSPHNYYITLSLRVGLLGLAALLLLYGIALRGTYLAARQGDLKDSLLGPDVIHVAIATTLVYFVPYSAQVEHGLLLGLAVAIASKEWVDRSMEARRAVVLR